MLFEGKSSGVIGSTVSVHHTLGGSLAKGKILHSKIKRREQMDKLMVAGGVIFFIAVILFIIKSRLGLTFFGLLG